MKRLGWLILISFSIHAQTTTLLFDLGGVLFKASPWQYAQAMNLSAIVSHVTLDWKIPSTKRIFTFIDELGFPAPEGFIRTRSTKGIELPLALCLYQAGYISRDDILKRADEVVPRLCKENFFVSEREERVLRDALSVAINPELNTQVNRLVTETFTLLKELRATNNYKLIAVSNWDRWSFAQQKAKFPEVFELFDDLIISGEIGLIKPHPAIFNHVLEKHGLLKEECLFIDDQLENIEAAERLAIPSVHFTNAYDLHDQLYELGILHTLPVEPFPIKKIAAIGLAAFIICYGVKRLLIHE